MKPPVRHFGVDELVGGALLNALDPDASSRALLASLLEGGASAAKLREQGLDPELVDSLRRALGDDPLELALACARGAAWARGRQSGASPNSWEPVLTVLRDGTLPAGVRRTTGETLTTLLTTARATVRFVAPFFDVAGASYLAEPIAAATSRRVLVQLYLPPDVAKKEAPLRLMKEALARTGRPDHFEVYSATERNPWPHLKVMIADSVAAYVGSANITGPGLRQGNLEFGVLVRGPQVAVIDGVVDLIPALERVRL